MSLLNLKRLSIFCFLLSLLGLAATVASAQTTTSCPGVPGTYVKLLNQPYALCAGAKTVNFDEITCALMKGTSISEEQKYPFPAVNAFTTIPNSGNIANVNQGAPTAGGYVVSTFTPPAGATLNDAKGDLAIYTCNGGRSYAQCDGGICFTSTTGTSSPLWGEVKANQIVCSCPIATTRASFQVFGPGACPRTQAAYDAVCATNVSHINNGAILYIGAPTGSPEALAKCVDPTFTRFRRCDRPAN